MLAIGAAAARLQTTPRALRYRERLGLLPPARSGRGEHRRYGDAELSAVRAAQALEAAYGVGPAELAFAVRVVGEPTLAAAVRELAVQAGRLPAEAIAALDFDAAKGRRLLAGHPGARRGGT